MGEGERDKKGELEGDMVRREKDGKKEERDKI